MSTFKMNRRREPHFVDCHLCGRHMNSESFSIHCKSRKHSKLLHEAQGLARFWIKVTGSPSVFLKEDIIRNIFEKQGKIQRIVFNKGAFYIRYLKIKNTSTALDNAYRGDYKNIVNLKLKVEPVYVTPSQPMEVDVFQVEPENNELDDFRHILSHTIRTIQSTPTQSHSFESIANQIVSSILSYAQNESGSNQVYSDLTNMFSAWCASVQRDHRLNFTVQLYIFGSVEIGLALSRFSDIDVYIDVGNTYLDMLHETTRLLFQNSDKFHDIVSIKGARVPIVKAIHSQSDIPIDISFKSKLGWYNTQLIKFYVKYDARVKTLLALIKIWFKRVELNDTRAFTSYSIYWLALFYLQQLSPPLIPSVRELLQYFPSAQCLRWKVMHSEEMQRTSKEYPPSKNSLSLEKLLLGFFQYYAELDLKNVVICPLLGKILPRSVFESENLDQLPREMDGYHRYAQEFPKDTLKISSQMCVQDPYDLSHNITKAVNHATLSLLLHHLDTVWILYKRNPSHLLVSLLEDANQERDALLHEFDVENETLRLQRLLVACKKARERKETREKESRGGGGDKDSSPSTHNSKSSATEQKTNSNQDSPNKSSEKQTSSKSNSNVISNKQTSSTSNDSESTRKPLQNKSEEATSNTTSKLKNSSDSDGCSERIGVKTNSSESSSYSTPKSVNSSTTSGSCSQQKNNFDNVGTSFSASTQKRPIDSTSKQKYSISDMSSTASRQQKTWKYSSGGNEQKLDARGKKSPDRGRRTLVITNSNKQGSPSMGLGRNDGQHGESSESRMSTDSSHLSRKEKNGQNTSLREKLTSDLSLDLDISNDSKNPLTFSEIVSTSHKKYITPVQSNKSNSRDTNLLTNSTDSIEKKDTRHSTSEPGATNYNLSQERTNATNHSQSTHSGLHENTPSQSMESSSFDNITKKETQQTHHYLNKSVENQSYLQNNKLENLSNSTFNSSAHLNQLVNLPMSSSSNGSNNFQSSLPINSNTAIDATSHAQCASRDMNLLSSSNNVNDHSPVNPLLQMFYNMAKPSHNGPTGFVPSTPHVSQQLPSNHQHLQQAPIFQGTPLSSQHLPQQTTTRTSPPGFPPMFPVPGNSGHAVNVPGPPGFPVNISGPPGIPVSFLENVGHGVNNTMFPVPVNALFASGTPGMFPVSSTTRNTLAGVALGSPMFPGTSANSTISGSVGNSSLEPIPVGNVSEFLGNPSHSAGETSSLSRFPGPTGTSSITGSPQSSTSSSTSSVMETLQRLAVNSPQTKLTPSELHSKNVANIENKLLGNISNSSSNTPNNSPSGSSNNPIKYQPNIGIVNMNPSSVHSVNNISLNPNSNQPTNSNPFNNVQINSSPNSVNIHHPRSTFITNNTIVNSTNQEAPVNSDLDIEAKLRNLKQMIGSVCSQNKGIVPLKPLKKDPLKIAYIDVNDLENNLRKKESIDMSKDSMSNLKNRLDNTQEPLNRSSISESTSRNISNNNTGPQTKNTSGHSREIMSQMKNISDHSKEKSFSNVRNTKDTSRNPRNFQMKPHSSSQLAQSGSTNTQRTDPNSIKRANESSIRNTSSRNEAPRNSRNANEKYHIDRNNTHNETSRNFKSAVDKSRNTRSEYETHVPAKEKEARTRRVESQVTAKDRSIEKERKESLSRNTSNMKAPTREVPVGTNVPMVNGYREASYHIQTDHKRTVTICIQEPHSIPDVVNFFNIANEVFVEYLEQVCLLQVNTKVYTTETEFLYRGEHGIDVCQGRKKLLREAGFNPPRALNHSKFQVEILKTNFLRMNARDALVKNSFVVSLVSRLVSRRGEREIQVSLLNENRKGEMSQYLSFVAFVQNGFDVVYKEMKTRCRPTSE
ncbi:hypothetical protein WDU94_001463 [Cyamophila willieti]